MKLTEEHFEVMEGVGFGATIWGYRDAKLLREVQQFDPSFIEIVPLDELGKYDPTVKKLTGAERLPYFGAVITGAGFDYIEKAREAAE
ncbi:MULTISPECIES: hypothetical protein [Bacillus]|uniref:Uncharacterized protein n=1 Tax=Bacillus glycinifermentans TaxID=1664069 RepID=A0AAJ3Z023_9BACI|nr:MULTISPECIES: hypothetical protein [Bacillus]MDU0070055.1 hypothetical protein [Bacillus sp. IG6]MED8017728.1 hypothetical protein [Bacillus glycinifermentans]QAT66391.1 hypothetical protein EQZ20_16790 [Bacillus glycinifermentans]